MIAIPIIVYWSVALWGLVSKRPILLYLFFATLPLGSLAVIPTAVTGGLTFVPTTMTAMLLICKCFANPMRLRTAVGAAFDPRRLGVLFAFWLTAVFVTAFMPRLFAGQVFIVPMRADSLTRAPLLPTIQNITQLAYLTISVVVVFAFSQLLKTRASRQMVLHAIVVAAAVAVLTGILDFAAQYVPLNVVLDPFRTASYAMLVDVELLGGKRVVGLMPEASSFGILCLSLLCLLYFLRRAILDDRVRNLYTPPLIGALMLFAWLSTSSATFVGLAIFAFMAVAEWIIRATEVRYDRLRRRHLGLEFAVLVVGLGAVVAILLFKPTMFDAMTTMLDKMVFKKAETSSFEERNMWTAVSLEALVDTYGLGVGLGGTRASNSVVAVVSNVGIVGAIFYFGFILQSLFRRAAPEDVEGRVLISAMRYAFVPPFTVGLLIGTTADFGGLGASRYGLLAAIGLGGTYAARHRQQRAMRQGMAG